MKDIENVIICGIGAIGSIYADKIHRYDSSKLRVLVDKDRLEKYTKNPKIFNGKPLDFNYILPEDNNFKADLIIIATKYDGLKDVVKNIENFVKEDTIIISLLNGVTSEDIIAEKYGWKHVPIAYYIGHSAMREGNNIIHDGIGTIVFGVKDKNKTDVNDIEIVKKYFDKVGIDYRIPEDMLRAYWLKYMLNVSSNQPSAILSMTFGQMQNNSKFIEFMKNIIREVGQIAKAEGVQDTEGMYEDAMKSFYTMTPDGKTSMLQDVEAGRKTEVDIFAGTMINFGKKHNIPTPYNNVLKGLIEIIHENCRK